MVQTGDPTGSGKGGESIYGGPFKDEFNSRITFNQRGLVAMANSGTPNDNGSQFFITLNECAWLNEKHTIFGMITGDTIYNLAAIGNVDTDEDDRPTEVVPYIIKTEVTVNPFGDMPVDTLLTTALGQSESQIKQDIINKRKSEREAKRAKPVLKNKKLISFQDDEESEDDGPVITKRNKIMNKSGGSKKKGKFKSSHEMLNDPKLDKSEVVDVRELERSRRKREEKDLQKQRLREKISQKKQQVTEESKDEEDEPKSLMIRAPIESDENDNQPDIVKTFKAKSRLLEAARAKTGSKLSKSAKQDSSSSSSDDEDDDSSSDNSDYDKEQKSKARNEEYDNLLKFVKTKVESRGNDTNHAANSEKVSFC